MRYNYAKSLRDDELRPHLDRGDTVFFAEAGPGWKEIEEQVERLGFGDLYAVSRATRRAPSGQHTHTRVSPLHAQTGLAAEPASTHGSTTAIFTTHWCASVTTPPAATVSAAAVAVAGMNTD
jgi:hypothetical protein